MSAHAPASRNRVRQKLGFRAKRRRNATDHVASGDETHPQRSRDDALPGIKRPSRGASFINSIRNLLGLAKADKDDDDDDDDRSVCA